MDPAECFFFFFNASVATALYTLSLHDALPILGQQDGPVGAGRAGLEVEIHRLSTQRVRNRSADRKSTRLNSSHVEISYAVFCLKKKNTTTPAITIPPSQASTHPALRALLLTHS